MDTKTVILKVYVAFVILLGLCFLVFLSIKMVIPPWLLLLLWVVILVLAELTPVKLPQVGAALSIDSAILLSIVMLFGPSIAAWFGVLSAVFFDGLIRKVPAYKTGFNGAQVVLALGGAGYVYYFSGGIQFIPDLPEDYNIYLEILLPLLLCSITYFQLNSLFVSIAVGFQRRIQTPSRNTSLIWRMALMFPLKAQKDQGVIQD